MARKKDDHTPKKTYGEPRQEIVQATMEDVMHMSMIPYAEHVILERALPRVEDGLKPVQRRILFTMNELGMTPDKPHRKCARIVGDCLGKYHPHGDSSVYDAMVRMAQPYSMRGILVDGHGNFGSIDGDSAAAMRYTEARMAPLALEMLRDIDKDTVSFSFNFDDTLKEPDMLPARYPNLLVNGASGIAVGLATNIPTHNLREAIDAVMLLMDKPNASIEEVMQIMPAPDFPTGGELLDSPEIKNAYLTGRGKLTLRAKVHIEDGSAGRKLIVVTEVPYQVPKAAMLEKILKLSEEKKAQLGGIYDIRDESDRTGLRAVIELKRDVDPQKVLAVLYKYSDLQVTFGVNMVAIAKGKPVQMGVREMITYYIEHQKDVVSRRTRYELAQAKAREHILAGLMIAVDNLDAVIKLIRQSKNPKEAKEGLMKQFALTDIQAQAILDMRLQRLTGLEILTLRNEYAEILKLIDRLESILKSEKKLLGVIKKEMTEIRDKFGDDRRTRIVRDDTQELPEIHDEPEAEETLVVLSRAGLWRRMTSANYKKLTAALGEGDDLPARVYSAMTDHTLYFFTNKGNCYQLPIRQLPETSRPKERGLLLSGLLAGLEKDEAPVATFCRAPGEMEKQGDLIFVTQLGMIKRTPAVEYVVRKSKIAAINLKEDDSVQAVHVHGGEPNMILFSRQGMSIQFSLDSVPATGRATSGVKAMSLDEGDRVCASSPVWLEGEMVLFTERGYGKRALLVDFDLQNRNGKGLRAFTFNKNGSNGTQIAGALYVREPYDFEIVQKNGARTHMNTDDIVIEARASKGRMVVMALMDDTVEALEPVPANPLN